MACATCKYSTTVVASVTTTCLDCAAGKYSTTVVASAAATCINCVAGKYSTCLLQLPASSVWRALSAGTTMLCPQNGVQQTRVGWVEEAGTERDGKGTAGCASFRPTSLARAARPRAARGRPVGGREHLEKPGCAAAA